MKTAGDILSVLFDERFKKKAEGYSKLFDSWADITAKNRIAAASAHSRIKDLDRGILLIETDHPGWKQILQTKQSKLLNDFRIRFPELDISGISLMLGKPESCGESQENESDVMRQKYCYATPEKMPDTEESVTKGYDAIKDDELREKLKKLGQTIAVSEQACMGMTNTKKNGKLYIDKI